MKKLYLLRHAKSDYPDNVSDDHERPLNKRGGNDSKKMGRYFKENNIVPQQILVSDAKRTTETIENVVKSANYAAKPEFIKKLYLATPGEILQEVANVDDSVESLMVVAHNPGIEQLAKVLVRSGKPEAIDLIKYKYPTCGFTFLSFDTDSWAEIYPASGYMEAFVVPKMVK